MSKRIRKLFVFLILFFVFCARDREDIQALKNYLSTTEHQQYLRDTIKSLGILKFGYDNIIAPKQLDSLKQVNQAYLAYLKKFEPKHKSTRKIQQSFINIGQSYQNEFEQILKRIEAFREFNATIDSLEALSRKSELIELKNQQRLLRESITNKFLIKRTQIFIHDITTQFCKFDE